MTNVLQKINIYLPYKQLTKQLTFSEIQMVLQKINIYLPYKQLTKQLTFSEIQMGFLLNTLEKGVEINLTV